VETQGSFDPFNRVAPVSTIDDTEDDVPGKYSQTGNDEVKAD
jgi:hypothetical protein